MQWIEAHRERYADEGQPPVPWERYLEVAPALCTVDPAERPEALAARDLDPDTWARAESYWVLTFAIDLQLGRSDRTEALGRACAEAHAKAAGAGSASRRDEEIQPAGDPVTSTASHESAPPAFPAQPPVHSTLPAHEAAPAVLTGPKALPSFLRQAGTPQAPPPMQAPVAPLAVPAIMAAVPPPAILPSAPAATSSHGRKVFDATLDVVPAQAVAPLPFGQAQSPEYAARLRTSPTPAAAPIPRAGHDATRMDTGPADGPATPFGVAGGPTSLPSLSLEQYAMLSAELAVQQDGPSRAAVLARYGVDGVRQLAALGTYWRKRLEQDPTVSARWKAVYEQHRACHQEKPR
jgi:hypothetical protein